MGERQIHYDFAHKLLPERFFFNAPELRAGLLSGGAAHLRALWKWLEKNAAGDWTPRASAALRDSVRAVQTVAVALRTEFSGDQTIGSRSEPIPTTVMGRIQRVIGSLWSSTAAPTVTHRRSLAIASEQLGTFLPKLRALADQLKRLGDQAESAGAPWTPGRIPAWRP